MCKGDMNHHEPKNSKNLLLGRVDRTNWLPLQTWTYTVIIMHGVTDRAHARSVSSEFVLLTVRMRTVESRKSVNDRAHAHGQI